MEKMEDWKVLFDDLSASSISQASQVSQSRTQRRRRRHLTPPSIQALPGHIRSEYTDPSLHQRYESFTDDSRVYFRLSVLNGWKKLNEYYTKIGASPLYAAAVILNPKMGLPWLEAQWTSPQQLVWLRSAKDDLNEYWAHWYRAGQAPSTTRPRTPRGDPQDLRRYPPAFETTQFEDWVNSRT